MTAQAPFFNTHQAIKRLTDSGFNENQAEGITEVLDIALTGGVATKADLQAVRADLQAVRADLQATNANVDKRIAELETRLTIRIGGGLLAIFGIIAYATKLILSAIAG